MKNLIILGAGRSGTSLIAGMLAGGGYNTGDNYLPPDAANPKGYFEDSRVTAINDAILRAQFPYNVGPALSRWWPAAARLVYRYVPDPDQLWLAGLPPWWPAPRTTRFDRAIQELLIAPYCFKDPRFYFTLPVWRPCVENAAFICVFRSPEQTAGSIVRICATPYLASLRMTHARAIRVWEHTYQTILRHRAGGDDWLFIHYEQALTSAGAARLESFCGARVDRSFPDSLLNRSIGVDSSDSTTYARLCRLANYTPSGGATG